ncbi:DHH family phosphoesterase [Absiella sp. AM29-15]|uniref:DHH family phosphoesterase n=1 Tax=Absiella sp. AM29-15 TaxID=2292278 RepID=UPI000E418A93|nr:bifunctional oligoribonuclease/PAP phosphatase NrnA [Absiella sp. AM29-15]RGC52477.1 bifunctional oligoribonuclease/PAP phosphatase NrnA [Absiella sp. AM29-15]
MNRILELIKDYDIITIYRHVSPDADALGSQYGLKQWINDTYPEKKVYALGNDDGSKVSNFPESDIVDDEIVKQSLAIILDTANGSRIDDGRWKTAAYRLKVDHHIFVEKFADEEYIEDMAGATCEILATMFLKEGMTLSKTAAQYLYSGLIADTLRYSIPSTTPQTLSTGAYLLSCGVDVQRSNEENFSTSLQQFHYENFLRSNCQVAGGQLAYIIVHKEDYERFGLSFNEAKEKVFVFGGVYDFKAWALFVEKEIDEQGIKRYNGSLRSRNITINDIAMKHHGGGHRFACGVKNLDDEEIQTIIQEILDRINEA